MLIPKLADDLKQDSEKRRILTNKRQSVLIDLNKGKDFFENMADGKIDAGLAPSAAKRMIEIIGELNSIDRQINDIDIIIVSKLEAYFGDFVAKFNLPERINDAGDVISRMSAYATPFKSEVGDLIEVSPDDIWFLKLVKDAFSAKNVEILSKEQYYSQIQGEPKHG